MRRMVAPAPPVPLSHHELVVLAEPFVRAGWRPDLAASVRQERRLAFAARDGCTLELAAPGAGRFTLRRRVALPDGRHAELRAEGRDAGELLALVSAVPPARGGSGGDGWSMAMTQAVSGTPAAPKLQLLHAEARVHGLTVDVKVSPVTGIPAELEFVLPEGSGFVPPEDLLAVLGWAWTPLRTSRRGWKAELKLRGDGARRSADAEAKLAVTFEHLARTLAEAPAQFHERHRSARWAVVGRRALPLAGTVALVAAAFGVARLDLADNSVWRMLIFHAPPLLLAGLFCLRELPRLEIPPLPRRSPAPAWHAEPMTR